VATNSDGNDNDEAGNAEVDAADASEKKKQWSQLFSDNEEDVEYASIQLAEEIYRVRREANDCIKTLQALDKSSRSSMNKESIYRTDKPLGTYSLAASHSIIGVKILELFVLDLLGRDSTQAKIFVNQRPAIQEKWVTRRWVKGVFVLLLLALNVFFVVFSIADGSKKGLQWQYNWMITCVVYIFSDIFIRHFNIAFIIYYFIPEMIKRHTLDMKNKLALAVNGFVQRARGQRKVTPQENNLVATNHGDHAEHDFSVTDNLFVSTLVAKAFPDLLESCIVLSYRSLLVSEHQSLKFTRAYRPEIGRGVSSLSAVQSSRSLRCKLDTLFSTCISVVSVVLSNMLLWLGCQQIFVQRILVQAINPLIMGLIAYIGSYVLAPTLGGTLVMVVIVFVIAAAVLIWQYGLLDAKRRTQANNAIQRLNSNPSAYFGTDTDPTNTRCQTSLHMTFGVDVSEHSDGDAQEGPYDGQNIELVPLSQPASGRREEMSLAEQGWQYNTSAFDYRGSASDSEGEKPASGDDDAGFGMDGVNFFDSQYASLTLDLNNQNQRGDGGEGEESSRGSSEESGDDIRISFSQQNVNDDQAASDSSVCSGGRMISNRRNHSRAIRDDDTEYML
jgi:hypothetical protein